MPTLINIFLTNSLKLLVYSDLQTVLEVFGSYVMRSSILSLHDRYD